MYTPNITEDHLSNIKTLREAISGALLGGGLGSRLGVQIYGIKGAIYGGLGGAILGGAGGTAYGEYMPLSLSDRDHIENFYNISKQYQ